MVASFAELVGRHLLVGLTFISPSNEMLNQVQFHGPVLRASAAGIVIERTDTGKEFTLPPDLTAYDRAEPGDYHLRSTGEIVANPDFVCSWSMHVQDREAAHEGSLPPEQPG